MELVLDHGGRMEIISYPKEEWIDEDIERLKKGIDSLAYKFVYESIYGEEFEVTSLDRQ